jgi:hypothetical protein
MGPPHWDNLSSVVRDDVVPVRGRGGRAPGLKRYGSVAEMTKTQCAGRALPEKLDKLGVAMLINEATAYRPDRTRVQL